MITYQGLDPKIAETLGVPTEGVLDFSTIKAINSALIPESLPIPEETPPNLVKLINTLRHWAQFYERHDRVSEAIPYIIWTNEIIEMIQKKVIMTAPIVATKRSFWSRLFKR